jgi:Skp family chaperone for outer membrane proteins
MGFRAVILVPAVMAGHLLVGQSVPPPGGKIGMINLQQAILETKDGRSAQKYLENEFAGTMARLKAEEAELDAARERLTKMRHPKWLPWKQAAYKKLAREIDRKNLAVRREREDARADAAMDQKRQLNELGRRMMSFLDTYAKDHGYSAILQGDVVTATPELATENVTKDVVKLYDEAHLDLYQPSTADPHSKAVRFP